MPNTIHTVNMNFPGQEAANTMEKAIVGKTLQ